MPVTGPTRTPRRWTVWDSVSMTHTCAAPDASEKTAWAGTVIGTDSSSSSCRSETMTSAVIPGRTFRSAGCGIVKVIGNVCVAGSAATENSLIRIG